MLTIRLLCPSFLLTIHTEQGREVRFLRGPAAVIREVDFSGFTTAHWEPPGRVKSADDLKARRPSVMKTK